MTTDRRGRLISTARAAEGHSAGTRPAACCHGAGRGGAEGSDAGGQGRADCGTIDLTRASIAASRGVQRRVFPYPPGLMFPCALARPFLHTTAPSSVWYSPIDLYYGDFNFQSLLVTLDPCACRLRLEVVINVSADSLRGRPMNHRPWITEGIPILYKPLRGRPIFYKPLRDVPSSTNP